MDLMNGQASSVNIAATVSEVRRNNLIVKFLVWLSQVPSIEVGYILKSVRAKD